MRPVSERQNSAKQNAPAVIEQTVFDLCTIDKELRDDGVVPALRRDGEQRRLLLLHTRNSLDVAEVRGDPTVKPPAEWLQRRFALLLGLAADDADEVVPAKKRRREGVVDRIADSNMSEYKVII